MNRILLLFFIVGIGCISPRNCGAQYSFNCIMGDTQGDDPVKVIEASNGNFYFTGIVNSWRYIACINPKGQVLWYKYYGYKGASADYINDMLQAANSFIYFGGQLTGGIPRFTKMDLAGNILLDTSYLLPECNIYFMLEDTSRKCIVSIGFGPAKPGTFPPTYYWYYQCTDYDGRIVYSKVIQNDTIGFHRIYKSGDHGYKVLALASRQSINGNCYIYDMDTLGNLGRFRSIPYNYELEDMVQEDSNSYLAVGAYKWVDGLGHDQRIRSAFFRFNDNGDSIWCKPSEYARPPLVLATNKNVFARLYLLDSNFNLIWRMNQSADMGICAGCNAIQTHDGGFAGCGLYDGEPRNWMTDPQDFWVFKTTASGQYDSSARDFFYMGIDDPGKKVSGRDLVVYPQPADTWLELNTTKQVGTVTLYDTQGKAWMQSRAKKLDVSTLPSGMYVLTVEEKGNARLHQQKVSIVHE